MTNNAQLLPLPELSDDDLELLHYNPNTSDVVEFLHRYAQSYALACIEAAKPADEGWKTKAAFGMYSHDGKIIDIAKPADALGSLPVVAGDLEELIGVYWDIAYQEGHLGRPDGSAAQETLNRIRAEIAKRDAVIEFQRKTLDRIEKNDLPTLRAKLAGVDGLVEALRKISDTTGNVYVGGLDAVKIAREALDTYEAAQGEKT